MYYQYNQNLIPKSDNSMTILFIDEKGQNTSMITHKDEIFFSLIKKYFDLTGKNGYFYFLSDGKQLKINKTIKECNLRNNSKVQLLQFNKVGGGSFPINFTDLS